MHSARQPREETQTPKCSVDFCRPAGGRRGETLVAPRRRDSAYIIIDTERCKGCCLCISACPKGIIGLASHIDQMGHTPAAVIEEKVHECTGCTVCAIMCPDTAISVYRRAKVLASQTRNH